MAKKKTHNQYVQELLNKNILYSPKELYINSATPILHECLNGHEWSIRPNHILSGINCPKCSPNRRKTTEEYKKDLLMKNINFIVLEPYLNARTPILHQCSYGHQWRPTPDNTLKGQGCPSCSILGFDPGKPAMLYYIKIISYHQEVYYKVGITNNSVEKRFSHDKDKIVQILMQKHFALGSEARLEEQSILKKYKDKRVKITDFLKSGGNTELFETDILGLDT